VAACATLLAGACGGNSAPSACADPLMLDDMEDGDRFICESGGRRGAWYVSDDGTSSNISPQGEFTQTLIPGGRGASRQAAHVTGFDFTDWGVAFGVSLNGDAAAAQPYDASAVSGIKFWMKSSVPVAVGFPIPATTLPAALPAGACADGPGVQNCGNHFQFAITHPTSADWTEYQVPFAALEQPHWLETGGNPVAGSATWTPSQLVNVQFAVDSFQTFDVWIDDVRLYSCAGDACLPTCTDPSLPVACPATGASAARCRPAGTTCAKTLTADLPGVWGTAANDVWITGYGGTILHWDGAAWTRVASPTTAFLSLPWGSGPNDIWVVGTGGAIIHWDGAAWSTVPSGTTEPLFGVWGSGPADVWVVGGAGKILHWNGAAWTSFASGTAHRLWRVWGSGPADVYAVGTSETTAAGVVLHWDGAAWSPVPGTASLGWMGVGGSGPDDVWIAGADGTIRHWNGSAWSNVPSPTTEYLKGVRAAGPSDAWAVGNGGTILRWNGTSWSATASPTSVWLLNVWASGPDDAWVVGLDGTILHWDGTAWSPFPVEVE
jgi:hypothetical protein